MNRNIARKLTSILLLLLMIAVFSVQTPLFFTVNNLSSILREASFVGIIACGMTFVIITGGIDISVGSTMALCAMVCSNLLRFTGAPLAAVLAVTALLGLALGGVNGLLVTKLNIPDFIVTLATMNIYRGLTRAINATDVESLKNPMIKNASFKLLGGRIGLIYLVVIAFFALALVSHYLLRHTRLGLYTYAVGSNAQAARLTGISFAGIKIFAFAFTGLACGIAGIMTAARMMTATTEIGVGMEFNVIAAIVIGGCSLQGGRGDNQVRHRADRDLHLLPARDQRRNYSGGRPVRYFLRKLLKTAAGKQGGAREDSGLEEGFLWNRTAFCWK